MLRNLEARRPAEDKWDFNSGLSDSGQEEPKPLYMPRCPHVHTNVCICKMDLHMYLYTYLIIFACIFDMGRFTHVGTAVSVVEIQHGPRVFCLTSRLPACRSNKGQPFALCWMEGFGRIPWRRASRQHFCRRCESKPTVLVFAHRCIGL